MVWHIISDLTTFGLDMPKVFQCHFQCTLYLNSPLQTFVRERAKHAPNFSICTFHQMAAIYVQMQIHCKYVDKYIHSIYRKMPATTVME